MSSTRLAAGAHSRGRRVAGGAVAGAAASGAAWAKGGSGAGILQPRLEFVEDPAGLAVGLEREEQRRATGHQVGLPGAQQRQLVRRRIVGVDQAAPGGAS